MKGDTYIKSCEAGAELSFIHTGTPINKIPRRNNNFSRRRFFISFNGGVRGVEGVVDGVPAVAQRQGSSRGRMRCEEEEGSMGRSGKSEKEPPQVYL